MNALSLDEAMRRACDAVRVSPPKRRCAPGRWTRTDSLGKNGKNDAAVLIDDDQQGGFVYCGGLGSLAQKANARRAPTRTRALTSPTCKEVEMAEKRICAVEGCCKSVSVRGFCPAHYQRWRKYGDPTAKASPREPKPKPSCAVEDCDLPSVARGWCEKHYWRWRRNGGPLEQKHASPGEAMRWLSEVALPFDSDACLTWPFATSAGYGRIWHDGAVTYPHRLICAAVNGPAPEGQETAHLCGNGHLGCVNPAHLVWKTRADNLADRLVHGTHNRGEAHPAAKLTEGEVRSIRKLLGTIPMRAIAERFQVSVGTIGSIAYQQNWGWLE